MKNRQNNILTLATKPERKNKKADVKFVKKNARNLPPSARTSLGQMVGDLKLLVETSFGRPWKHARVKTIRPEVRKKTER